MPEIKNSLAASAQPLDIGSTLYKAAAIRGLNAQELVLAHARTLAGP